MQKHSYKFSLVLMLVFMSSSVFADDEKEDATNSNLTSFSYPTHTCGSKPSAPGKPPALISSIDVDAHNILVAQYNVRVAIYNKSIKTYKACINDFIKNGNIDMDIIRKQLDAALKEARKNN